MSSRLSCWLHGHEWGEWSKTIYQNIFGVEWKVRWCDQCGAMDRKAI